MKRRGRWEAKGMARLVWGKAQRISDDIARRMHMAAWPAEWSVDDMPLDLVGPVSAMLSQLCMHYLAAFKMRAIAMLDCDPCRLL